MKKSIATTVFFVLFLLGINGSFAEIPNLTGKNTGLIWGGCGITKKAFMAELAKAYEIKTGIYIDVKGGGGATRGIRDVAKKQIDIGGSCRSNMEFDGKERYVEQTPVAWDALVFIVNKENPVNDISLEQVRKIYDGDITSWSQLGGEQKKLDLYVRKSVISGVGQTLRELVFHDSGKTFSQSAIVVKSSTQAEMSVERAKLAITATGISSAKRRDVKVLRLNGQLPSYENIKNGHYMLYRPIYLVTSLVDKNPMVTDFLNYATSEEGKKVIRSVGTVPYTDAVKLIGKHFREYEVAFDSGL